MAEPREAVGRARRLVAAATCGGLALVVGTAYGSLPSEGSPLARLVEQSLPGTGVTSRVTAVLLGFRGYDTMLEVAVLLVAAVAVRGIASRGVHLPDHVGGVALGALLRLIAPLGILVAAAIVWRGGHAAGGAFQAAAVLGGIVIALALGGVPVLRGLRPAVLRGLLVAGPAAFLAVGVAGLLAEGAFLQVPRGLGAAATTTIEIALTVSIGLSLALLPGEAPTPDGPVDEGAERERART